MIEHRTLSRRDALVTLGAAAGVVWMPEARASQAPVTDVVARNDAAVEALLRTQVTDAGSAHRGSVPDQLGLHSAGSAGNVAETMTASFVDSRSRYRGDGVLLDRIRLAAGFLERAQSPQGNIDLLTTNFNSPPDTGFVVHGVATAARIAQLHGVPAIVQALQPFLVKAGGAMAEGGVHTPNHRWVVSSALAQINELFPDPHFVRRIDQWLAEGVDIDADGQFTERSTLTYNIVTDRALLVMAIKLNRPALIDPVRRNLEALLYLLHADGEVVTEISRRQDQYTRGTVTGYWFPLTYLALKDGNGRLATLARAAADGARLSTLLEYPELAGPLPASALLPDDFERQLSAIGIARIRRGPRSATVILGGSSRLLTLRSGPVVLEGVRFATSFFGKGQFVPDVASRDGAVYRLRQSLVAPYYQPLPQPVTPETWAPLREKRAQSEIARLEQSAEISETPRGFRLRVRSSGTPGVPLAIELTFREGAELLGCSPIPGTPGAFLLERGTGTCRAAGHEIRFGPGLAPHRYTQLRGAEPRLSGNSVYITGFTPFDAMVELECS
jgi:hypothetical protein